VNSVFNEQIYSPAVIASQLTALAGTGVTIARSDALWEATEPSPPTAGRHTYNWTFDDAVASALARVHLRWLPIIDYTAPWAASIPGQEHTAPRVPDAFAAFAGAFAGRFGPGGRFWREHPELTAEPVDTYEIWNEPDVQFFWLPAPDPARYADLYLRARDAIELADPSARVIVGGLGHPETFVPALVAARPGISAHIDGVAVHPYLPHPRDILARIRTDRRILDTHGLAAVPLYVTETGWSTSPPRVPKWAPARLRPGYIERLIGAIGHIDCRIAATVLYSWMTPERNPGLVDEWFGIHPPAGGETDDTRAFAAALRAATEPQPPAPIRALAERFRCPAASTASLSDAGSG
jgi:hypothetical protein